MLITFTARAPGATIFESDAFDGSIGKMITVKDPSGGALSTEGRLVAAVVADDQRFVHLTIDVAPHLGMPTMPSIDPPSLVFDDGGGLVTMARVREPISEVTYRIEPIDGGSDHG